VLFYLNNILRTLVFGILTSALIACGGGDGGALPSSKATDTVAPKIILTNPASEDIDIKVNTDIIVTFDKAITTATQSNVAISPITSNNLLTFSLPKPELNTIIIRPDTNEINGSTIYEVTISDVKSESGVMMQNDCVWKFETKGPAASILMRTGRTGPCGTIPINWTGTKQLGVASAKTAGNGISIDNHDNVYVTGSTSGGLDGNTVTGSEDFFITKYHSSGVKEWTKLLGVASASTFGTGISIDSQDNVFVTGFTTGGLDGNTVTGLMDFFITKYTASGVKKWTRQLGVVSANTRGTGISIDSQDNVFVTGYTTGGLDGNTVTGVWDFFITKYTALGVKRWTRQLGVASASTFQAGISIDSQDNVFVTGFTSGGLDGNTVTGLRDFFITKYTASGVKKWTRQLGVVSANTRGAGISIDSQDNIFVTGNTSGGLDGNTVTGSVDFFITKYNKLGEKVWTRQLGVVSANTRGTGISIDSQDNVFVTGYTTGGLDGNTETGVEDFFITKYNKLGEKVWTRQLGVASAWTRGTGISIDSQDNVFVTGTTTGGLDGNTVTGTKDFFIMKYTGSGVKQ